MKLPLNFKESMSQDKEIDELSDSTNELKEEIQELNTVVDDFFNEAFEPENEPLTEKQRISRAIVVYNYSDKDIEDVALQFDVPIDILKKELNIK